MAEPQGCMILVRLKAPLEGVKRATPEAHLWINSEIVRRVNALIAADYPGAQRRVGIGPVRSDEVVVKGPAGFDGTSIRQACLEGIGRVAEEIAEEFRGFHWRLPSGHSGSTIFGAHRLPDTGGGITVAIGPATRDVLEELRAAGWQIHADHALRTIRESALEDTIAWLQERGICGPT